MTLPPKKEKEAALKREREEALKKAENQMTDLERLETLCQSAGVYPVVLSFQEGPHFCCFMLQAAGRTSSTLSSEEGSWPNM